MRYCLAAIAALSALCSRARAEVIAAPPVAAARASAPLPAELSETRLALTVNAPTGWLIGSLGASAYVRLGDHLAVRANIARYRNSGPAGQVVAGFTGNDGTGYGGDIFDVGIAAVWYPRRAWDGLFLEAGVLRRARDVYVWPETEEKTFTTSTEYGGRALIGWSWLIRDHVILAVAAGLSTGRESGHSSTTDYRGNTMTSSVNRRLTETEGYTRVGWAF
jgi:hypothetical protein